LWRSQHSRVDRHLSYLRFSEDFGSHGEALDVLDAWYISRQEIPMALSLKDPEADRLAREVAARTGETLTAAVVVALRERLARLRGRPRRRRLRDELRDIAQRCAQLPTLDDRSAEEILAYDQRGLPR
jgi:antitoxin VapB